MKLDGIILIIIFAFTVIFTKDIIKTPKKYISWDIFKGDGRKLFEIALILWTLWYIFKLLFIK